jgi:hypothetical protein
MVWIEAVFYAVLLLASWGILVGMRVGETRRDRPRGETKTISREIQDEIDQTPEWWDREFQKLLRQATRIEDERVFYKKHEGHEITEDRTFSGVVARHCLTCAHEECVDPKWKYVSEQGRKRMATRERFSPGGYWIDPKPPTVAEMRPSEYVLVGFNERGEDVYDRA